MDYQTVCALPATDVGKRPSVTKISFKARLLGPFDYSATVGNKHMTDVVPELRRQIAYYNQLDSLVIAIFDCPHRPIDELLTQYYPDMVVRFTRSGKQRVTWYNDFITVVEEIQ